MPGRRRARDVGGAQTVEQRTQAWLDDTMDPGITALGEHLVYDAAGQPQRIDRVHFGRLRRKLKIFRWLDRFEFASFIDVASGWEHYPFLVRTRYGAEAYYSDMVHRMNVPTDWPGFGKRDRAVTVQLPRLPFADQAFDVVLCSEVLEHLVHPIESLAELWRITRKYLIVTSMEALSVNRWEQVLSHLRVDVRQPHVERNFFVLSEFEALLGSDLMHENLQFEAGEPVSPFADPATQDAALAELRDVDTLAAALVRAVSTLRHGAGALGILLVKARADAPIRPAAPTGDLELARWLIGQAAYEERQQQEVLALVAAWEKGAPFPDDAVVARGVAPALITLLRCPDCRGLLAPDGLGLRCGECPQGFDAEGGVPILYPTRPHDDATEAEVALARLCGGDRTRARIGRALMRRLRRNDRPPGLRRRAVWTLIGLLRRAQWSLMER
jgi:SAM-dependent methyltransferase